MYCLLVFLIIHLSHIHREQTTTIRPPTSTICTHWRIWFVLTRASTKCYATVSTRYTASAKDYPETPCSGTVNTCLGSSSTPTFQSTRPTSSNRSVSIFLLEGLVSTIQIFYSIVLFQFYSIRKCFKNI